MVARGAQALLMGQEMKRLSKVLWERTLARARLKGCEYYDNGGCTGGDYCESKGDEKICCIECDNYSFTPGFFKSSVENNCPDSGGICAVLKNVDPSNIEHGGGLVQEVRLCNNLPYMKSAKLRDI